MHGRITRAFLAAAASATIAASGFIAAGTAGAATAPPAVYTDFDAGYTAVGNGQRFERIETTLKVPARQPIADHDVTAAISLTGGRTHTEAIVVLVGGGRGSVGYVTARGGKAFALSPRVGDTLKVSIAYNQRTHRDRFAVTDTRIGKTVAVTLATGGKSAIANWRGGIVPGTARRPGHALARSRARCTPAPRPRRPSRRTARPRRRGTAAGPASFPG